MDKKLSKKALLGIIIGVLVIVAIICAVILLNRNKLTAMVMRLIRQEGEVALLDASGQDVAILDNMKLYSGNALETGGDGLVDLSLDDTKYLTIENKSNVVFEKSGKALELKLNSGRLFFNVTEKLADDETMDISTSTMVVGIRGTSGWVDADNSDIYIGDGTLHITGINPKTGERIEADFTAGQKVHVYLLDEDGKTVAFELENYTIEDVPREMLRNIVQYPELFRRFVEETGFEPKAVIREAIIKKILPEEMNLPEEYEELLEEVLEEMKEPEEEEEEEPEEVEEVETPTTNRTVTPQNTQEEEPPAAEQPAAQQSSTPAATTPTTYTVTVNAATGGTASASATSAEAGTAITLTATPDAGYELTGWTVNEGGVTVSDNSFTMPEGNVSITPKFRGTTLRSVVVQWFIGGNDSPDDVWGTASVSSDGANATQGAGDQYYSSYTIQARAGDEVTIAATPTSGMNSSFRTWTLTGGSSVIDASSATNTFTMPDEDINAKADFVMGTYTVVLKTEENANITPYYGDTPITSVEQSFQVAYDTPIVITGGATSAQSSRRGSNQQDLDITYTYDAQSQQLTINLKPGAGENVTITLH
jgi:hypothetical protein